MGAIEMIKCLLAALINSQQTFDRLQWIELFIFIVAECDTERVTEREKEWEEGRGRKEVTANGNKRNNDLSGSVKGATV